MSKPKPMYFITFFKLEGHEKWRVHAGRNAEAFDKQLENNKENHPVIIEKRVLKMDRITGQLS